LFTTPPALRRLPDKKECLVFAELAQLAAENSLGRSAESAQSAAKGLRKNNLAECPIVDLTNVQFPMLNSYPNRGRPHESERF